MKVRYTRRARADLVAILEYLRERSPQGANKVGNALKRTLDLIGNFPEAGRQSGEQDTRVIRVGRYPYLVYWGVATEEVIIVHIRHAARRPWRGEN